MNHLRNCRGGISIFLCILFIAVFLFAGILTDVARIMAAEGKVQGALNSSLRSTLAGYDADLYGDYGIFGMDSGETPQKNFQQYFKTNLQNKNGLKLIDYQMGEEENTPRLQESGSLLAGGDFKSQILEYMKYRAPLDMAQGILDKFSASGIFRKLRFSKAQKGVRSKEKKLQKQIKKVNDAVDAATGSISKGTPEGVRESLKAMEDAVEVNAGIEDSLSEYNREKAKTDEIAAQKDENELVVEGSEIQGSSREYETLPGDSRILGEALQQNILKLKTSIAEMDAIQGRISQLESNMDQEDITESERQADAAEEANLNSRLSQLITSIRLEEMKTLPKEEPNREEAKDDGSKAKAQGFLDSFKNNLSKFMKDMREDQYISKEDFEKASEEVQEQSREMELEGTGEAEEEDAEGKNDGVIGYLEQLFDLLPNFAKAGVEKTYIIDYIMNKCTFATSSGDSDHYFQKGEVEYILWGNGSQLNNITKTMASVWFLRFAIDTVDYLATSKNPIPVFRLIGALVRGFIQSCSDMVALYQGKEISLCPSVKKAVTLTYRDHLQIFLFIKSVTGGGENVMLNRMRQLIQNNLGQSDQAFRLKNCSTSLHVKVKVRINLWFLPFFQLEKLGIRNFERGGYIIEKEAHYGY